MLEIALSTFSRKVHQWTKETQKSLKFYQEIAKKCGHGQATNLEETDNHVTHFFCMCPDQALLQLRTLGSDIIPADIHQFKRQGEHNFDLCTCKLVTGIINILRSHLGRKADNDGLQCIIISEFCKQDAPYRRSNKQLPFCGR